MCGIFGVFRYIPASSTSYSGDLDRMKSIAESLLLDSERRGRDSSGMVVCNNRNNKQPTSNSHINAVGVSPRISMYKAPKKASEFVKDEAFKKLMSQTNDFTSGIFGHTRAHTHGHPQNNINNHPHRCGNIIGVHNGVIVNYLEAASILGVTLKSKCDSEVIFAGMDKLLTSGLTIEQTLKKLSSILRGTYACIAVNADSPHKPIFFRHGSPIVIRIREYNPSIIVVASEEEFIQNAYNRHIKITNTSYLDKKPDNVLEMFSFTLPDNGAAVLDLCGAPGSYNSLLTDWLPKTKQFSMEEEDAPVA
jgi:glucosamine 6-phosphate synthetase-like amidotransferase/phosphosugar isomerase protein